MKMEIVAVRDRATEAYAQPIFVPALGVAIRSFQDEVNREDPNNNLNLHPEDFALFHLGTYDDNTGLFDTLEAPVGLLTGSQAKKA